jgi:hypothetical protein
MKAHSWYSRIGSAITSARKTITLTVIRNPSIALRNTSTQRPEANAALSGLSRRKSQ